MEYLVGALTGVGCFVVFGLVFALGYRLGQKKKPSVEAPDDETVRKQKKIHEDFQKLMNYDLDTALQRKQVTDE